MVIEIIYILLVAINHHERPELSVIIMYPHYSIYSILFNCLMAISIFTDQKTSLVYSHWEF